MPENQTGITMLHLLPKKDTASREEPVPTIRGVIPAQEIIHKFIQGPGQTPIRVIRNLRTITATGVTASLQTRIQTGTLSLQGPIQEVIRSLRKPAGGVIQLLPGRTTVILIRPLHVRRAGLILHLRGRHILIHLPQGRQAANPTRVHRVHQAVDHLQGVADHHPAAVQVEATGKVRPSVLCVI